MATSHSGNARRGRSPAPATRLVIFVAALLLAGSSVYPDMAARNFYWARIDSLVQAASVFPAREAAAFEASLRQEVVAARQPPRDLGPAFVSVSEYGLLDGVAALVKARLAQGEVEKARSFLAAVNAGRWVRGTLVARNGGDFVTSFELVSGADGGLVLRQRNAALGPGDWKGTTFEVALR